MRRAYGETLMSIGALAILVLALVAFDGRVRQQVSLWLSTPPAALVADVGYRLRGLTSVVVEAAHRQGIEHTTLLFFVLASAVLTVFMLRT
jgi:hypothetical protein